MGPRERGSPEQQPSAVGGSVAVLRAERAHEPHASFSPKAVGKVRGARRLPGKGCSTAPVALFCYTFPSSAMF